MRGSLVVLCAALAGGGLVLANCSEAKKAKPAPSVGSADGSARGPTPPGPGSAPPPGPGTATGGSPGATGPDPSFEMQTEPASAAAAATGNARIVVHPGPGLHMNMDYPTGLTLQPPAGVTVTNPSLSASDAQTFNGKELTFQVAMSAAAQGQYKVPGTFKFAVCDDGACYPKKRAIELLLTVQ